MGLAKIPFPNNPLHIGYETLEYEIILWFLLLFSLQVMSTIMKADLVFHEKGLREDVCRES